MMNQQVFARRRNWAVVRIKGIRATLRALVKDPTLREEERSCLDRITPSIESLALDMATSYEEAKKEYFEKEED